VYFPFTTPADAELQVALLENNHNNSIDFMECFFLWCGLLLLPVAAWKGGSVQKKVFLSIDWRSDPLGGCVTRWDAVSSKLGMGLTRILPLFGLLLMAPALESQNSSAAPAPPPAQSPATPVTTLSVDVNVVTLPVTVRDKKGKIVHDLTKDDFELQEDGKPQSIRYFSQETNLPLTVGLLVDTSMSERDNIDKERSASRSFLDQMITRPQDRAFVIHFDREIELLPERPGRGAAAAPSSMTLSSWHAMK
jgi:hypothetical protein